MDKIINQNVDAISNYQNQLKKVMLPQGSDDSVSVIEEVEPFSTHLTEAIDRVDHQLTESGKNIEKLITGDLDNLHTAMIDMNKSQLVLQTAVQVRNKCVESYNEIKNMQF